MIYHDMLGVRENATASEIDCAYEKKCSALENGDVKLTQEQLTRKRQELEKAKAACLAWQSMSVGERSSRRVQQYMTEIGDPARTNAICFGPFTFFNLLFCSCCNDSAICNSGGCSLTTLAAICDLVFYGFFAASLWREKKETEEKKKRVSPPLPKTRFSEESAGRLRSAPLRRASPGSQFLIPENFF